MMVVAGLILLVLAAVLLKRGAWPPRVGDTPHCRRCNYILHGLTGDASAADRCPECGAFLTATNIVRGERLRARRLVASGAVLALAGVSLTLVAAVDLLRPIHWYGYKPAGWVIDDLESNTPAVRDRAWAELTARRTDKRLSPAHLARLEGLLVRLYATNAPTLPKDAPEQVFGAFGRLTPEQQTAVVDRLLGDLTSNLYTDSTEAQHRLDALLADNRLAPGHHARLTALALRTQAAERKNDLARTWLLDYLGGRELAGQLSPAHREQFFANAFRAELTVRPQVLAGEPVPYQARFEGPGPSTGWWSRHEIRATRVDDQPPQRQGGSMSGQGFGGGIGSTIQATVPGKHTLTVVVKVSAYNSEPFGKPVPERWSRELTLAAPFEVLPAGGPDPLRWIDDPALAGRIRRAIRLHNVRASTRRWNAFVATLEVNKLPVAVAFDILARTGGKEYPVGKLDTRDGRSFITGINAEQFPPGPNVGTVDVIFRSSEKVAKGTTYIREAWRGEVVYEKVPVAPGSD